MKSLLACLTVLTFFFAAQASAANEVRSEMSLKIGQRTVTIPVKILGVKGLNKLSPEEKVKLRVMVQKWRSISRVVKANAQIP